MLNSLLKPIKNALLRRYNLVSGLPEISISKKTKKIGATWQTWKVWDKHLIEKFYSLLKSKDDFFVVFDVGAQTGSMTLLAKYFPNTKWYAFEPIKEAADELIANLALNNIENVVVTQACVSNKEGWSSLKLPKDEHWGLATLGEQIFRFKEFEEREVKAITLDEFVKKNEIQKVDFIKIDTEGWELFILQGGIEMLKKSQPIILMEYNKDNLRQCQVDERDIFALLESLNYQWEAVSHDDLLCMPKSAIVSSSSLG